MCQDECRGEYRDEQASSIVVHCGLHCPLRGVLWGLGLAVQRLWGAVVGLIGDAPDRALSAAASDRVDV